MRRRARAGGLGHRPARSFPAQGRRAPRVKGRPQAGPAGTRSALDAWAAGPYQRPPPTPTALPSHQRATSSRRRVATTARIRPSAIGHARNGRKILRNFAQILRVSAVAQYFSLPERRPFYSRWSNDGCAASTSRTSSPSAATRDRPPSWRALSSAYSSTFTGWARYFARVWCARGSVIALLRVAHDHPCWYGK